jgi:phosphoribosyl 1,2-cyclic phosphate phosphodiesterase
VLGERVVPIPLEHSHFHVLGFRIGDLAYCTDVNRIPDASWPLLAGLDMLILDALRPDRSHPSHFSLEEAMTVGERLKVKRLVLTHMSHEMDYETLSPTLPPGVELGYDGMTIEF